MAYYRIHSADESPETVLDPTRPDGWVASDEAYETQPHGVSACGSIGDRYLGRELDPDRVDALLEAWS